MAKKNPAPSLDYFSKDPENEDRAICKVVVEGKPCGESKWAKGGTTTTILRHLKERHKEEHEECRNKMEKLKPSKKKEVEKAENESKQKKLKQDFFGESDASLNKRVSDAVVDFLADTGVAFRVAGRPSFINLMHVANKRIKLKSPLTYSRMVKTKAEEILNNVAGIIETVRSAGDLKSVSFTTDIWTSRSMDPYMCLTVHFIDANFHLHRWTPFVKPFPSSHTGLNISLELTCMLQVSFMHIV